MTAHLLGEEAQSLLDGLPLPSFGCDADGRLSYWNRAFEELFDLSKEESNRCPAHDLLGLEEGSFEGTIEAHDGTRWKAELRRIGTDELAGVLWPLSPEAEGPQPLNETVVSVLVGLSKGLTLPMREEDIIQLFAETFEKLLPGTSLCLRLVSPDTQELRHVFANGRLLERRRDVVTISRAALERFGRPEGLTDRGAVEISDELVPVFDGTVAGFDIPLQDDFRLLGALSFEYAKAPRSLESDRLVAWSVSLHLSTAVRNARLLGESIHGRDYLGKLLDNANAPIVVTDRERAIKVVNRAFERLTGWSRRDILDRDVMKLLPDTERERFLPAFIHALRGEQSSSLELRIPRKEGGDAHLAFSTAAVKSAYGEIEGVVAIGQDMTELRQLQQQVIHSEKLATLGQLAAGVVHELNNPLTSISVYSEFLLKKLEREGGDESDQVKLSRICEGADRILRFTRDLVTYARPAGEEPSLLDLRDVVERSLVFCEHVFARAGAKVTMDFEEDLPEIYGLKGQLQQVMVNLVTNACDAMPQGSGVLVVTLRSAGERVRLSVADNGPGVSGEDSERIFEPFFSTKAEGKGTGLGLSIVRNIITNHNGEIEVESDGETGTTFHIELFAGG